MNNELNLDFITENLKHINENIAAAAAKSGRNPEDITLIAVTKTIPAAVLQGYAPALLAGGVRNLGENRVQELVDKQPQIDSFTWHMIGNLQRNKVKFVVGAGNVALIHSVDSLRLAEEISRIAANRQVVADVLVEINIAAEDSKHGVSPANAKALTEQIAALPNIAVKGLMTVAPFVDNPEDNRPLFRTMAELNSDCGLPLLSMGMTNDYQVAIEEGANMVRIGTAIFGAR